MRNPKAAVIAVATVTSVCLLSAPLAQAASVIKPGSRMVFAPYTPKIRVTFDTATDGTKLEERRAYGKTTVQSGPGKGLGAVITVDNTTIEPDFGNDTSLRNRKVIIRLSDRSQIVCEGQAVTLQDSMAPAGGTFGRLPCFDGVGIFAGSDAGLDSQLLAGGQWVHTLVFRKK